MAADLTVSSVKPANLTDKAIKAAKPTKYPGRIPDGRVSGLCLVIAKQPKEGTAAKSWAFRYTSPTVPDFDKSGKQKVRVYKDKEGKPTGNPILLFKRIQMTIGRYPDTSLADARKSAQELRNEVDNGIDPALAKEDKIQVKRKEDIQEAAAGSVADLFNIYIEDLRLDKSDTSGVKQVYKTDISPAIDQLKAKDVTTNIISDLLSEIINPLGHPNRVNQKRIKPADRVAELTRGYLHRAFELGLLADEGGNVRWVSKIGEFGLVYNPVVRAKLPERNNIGTRDLSDNEVKRFWREASVVCMEPDMALAIKLLLATGQRVQEVLSAKWNEFVLEDNLVETGTGNQKKTSQRGRVWLIPPERRKIRKKAQHSEPHLIPLTGFTISLLNELKKLSDSEFLFPDATGQQPKHYRVLSKTVDRFCRPAAQSKRKPFNKFSPRDCRRTFKTLAASLEITTELLNRIQGHAFSDVASKHYNRYDYLKEKREAMGTYNTWLYELVDFTPTDVVDIRAVK